MLWLFLFLVVVVQIQAAVGATINHNFTSLQHVVDISFDYSAATLRGNITYQVQSSSNVEELYLRLWNNGQQGMPGCGGAKAWVKILTGAKVSDKDCTVAKVVLPASMIGKKAVTFTISFLAFVPRNYNWRYGKSGEFFLLNAAFPSLALNIVDKYTFLGEAQYSICGDYHVRLKLFEPLHVASTGKVVSVANNTYEIVALQERDFAFSFSRLSQVKKDSINVMTAKKNITVTYYYHRKRWLNGFPASTILTWAKEAVVDFSNRYGEYKNDEIEMVSGLEADSGYENPGVLFIEKANRNIVVHEIAHLWFYDMVGNNQFQESWLDESFTTFITVRHQKLLASRWCYANRPFKGWVPQGVYVPLDSPMSAYRGNFNLYESNVYGGGACVLYDLMNDMGEAKFDDLFVKRIVSEFGNKIITTCDVLRILNETRLVDVAKFKRHARIKRPCS